MKQTFCYTKFIHKIFFLFLKFSLFDQVASFDLNCFHKDQQKYSPMRLFMNHSATRLRTCWDFFRNLKLAVYKKVPLMAINASSTLSYKASSFRFVLNIVRRFLSSFRFVFDIVAHNVEGKSKNLQYIGVRIFSQILTIFIVHSIQFFILSSKLSKFLKLNQK